MPMHERRLRTSLTRQALSAAAAVGGVPFGCDNNNAHCPLPCHTTTNTPQPYAIHICPTIFSTLRMAFLVGTVTLFTLAFTQVVAPGHAMWPRHHGTQPNTNKETIKGAYWPGSAESAHPPNSINTDLYTHLLYAFAGLDSAAFELQISPTEATRMSSFTATLDAKTPKPVTLLSIGGGGADPSTFATMAKNQAHRKTFIASSISTARKYGFDGLDLDWEFPNDESEMSALASLLSEWRTAVDAESGSAQRPPLLLTAAVYYASKFILANDKRSYPVATVAETLDWVNVMNYDYHGTWDISETGAVACLYDPKSNISTSFGISSWLSAGMPANKLVMGLPMYGRSWILKDADSDYHIGAPAVAAGPVMKLSNESGVMFYSEIAEMVAQGNATEVFDRATVSAYAYSGDLWVTFDDEYSVAGKIVFAKMLGLRGYFFWAVNQDPGCVLSSAAAKAWNTKDSDLAS